MAVLMVGMGGQGVATGRQPDHRRFGDSEVGSMGGAKTHAAGLDHYFGQRRKGRTADPTIRPRSVGSAVRTIGLAASAVAGIMTKAAPQAGGNGKMPPVFRTTGTDPSGFQSDLNPLSHSSG